MKKLIVLLSVVQLAHQQAILFDLHPAANPQVIPQFKIDAIGTEFDDIENEEEVHSLMDPEGHPALEADKERVVRLQEQRRKEEQKIRLFLEEEQKESVTISTWIYTLIGSGLVVSCGVIPAFLLPKNAHEFLESEDGKQKLNCLLSFAVGSMLADVFLHLLPESYSSEIDQIHTGLCILAGILLFFFVEKLGSEDEEDQHQMCAIMNLVANVVDNFTHGLAVGGSFLISPKFGIMTTVTILMHELPHEVSDFAILLRADYNRMDAIKAQAVTASAGILGSIGALWIHSSEVAVLSSLIPFIAGGFINIALTQILSQLNEETNTWNNLKQMCYIGAGIASMSILNSAAF